MSSNLEKVLKKVFVLFGTIVTLIVCYSVINFIIASFVALAIGLVQNVPFWNREFFNPIYGHTNLVLFIVEGIVTIPALVKNMSNFDK